MSWVWLPSAQKGETGREGRSGTVATMFSPEDTACSTDSVVFPLAQAAVVLPLISPPHYHHHTHS